MASPAYFEKERASANENYVGFSAQPAGGGMINILSANDLMSDVQPMLGDGRNFFQKRPLFVDNCQGCSNQDTMNASGKTFSNAIGDVSLGDLFQTGAGVFTSYQQSQAQQAQAQAAAQIAQANAALAAQQTANTNAQGASISKIVKSWALPIFVGGIVIVGGLIAYNRYK